MHEPTQTAQDWLLTLIVCFAVSLLWWEVRLAFLLRLIDLCEWGMSLVHPFVDKRDALERRLKALQDGRDKE